MPVRTELAIRWKIPEIRKYASAFDLGDIRDENAEIRSDFF